jgi:hypothetical protein
VSDRKSRTQAEREAQRTAWPTEYRDGARVAYLQQTDGEREPGGYPMGFASWPVERRNSWFAGFNEGRCDRLAQQNGGRSA